MKGFDAKEGLIHFLFAEEDDYYLDCLLKLDLTHFIYYNLRKQNYDGIYFLKQENTIRTFLGSKEKISVYCMDQKSADAFPVDAGYLGGMICKTDKPWRNHRLYGMRGKKEAILTRIQMLMKKEQKCAFVIPLPMMQTLLRTDTFRDALRNKVRGKSDNCMIALAASKAAEDSFGELCTLAEADDLLFKEVADILKSREKLSFYQNMNLKYGNRMQVWNQMDQNSISNMLRRMLMEGNFRGNRTRWKNCADLLYIYTSDTEIQAELRPFMERDAEYSLSAMRRSLDSDKIWNKINRLLEAEPKEEIWRQKVKNVQWKRGVRYPVFTREGSTLNAMNILKRELEKQREEYGIRWDENCLKVQRIMDHVRTPWNSSNDYENIETYVTQCVVQMQYYAEVYQTHSRDLRYSPVTAIINDIWYRIACNGSCYQEKEVEKEKQQTYDAAIQASVTLMECLKKYELQKQKIDDQTLELKRNLEKKAELEPSINKELQMKESVFIAQQSLRLKELDANIVDAKNRIKSYTKANEVLLSNIQSLKGALETANLGLSQLTGGSVAEMSVLLKRLNNLNGFMQKQMSETGAEQQQQGSEIQEEKLYESQEMEVHIHGI